MANRDTRNVVFSMLVLVGLLAGLFILFESRYQRLTELSARIARIQDRQKSLAEFRGLMSELEASQRGFLLTADPAQLELMRSALPRVGDVLRALAKSSAREGVRTTIDVAELEKLAVERIGQLEHSLRLHVDQGAASASNFIRSDAGLRTSNALRDVVRTLDMAESDRLVRVLTQWLEDLRTTRWAMAGATLLNGVLIVLLGTALYREMRRKSREASELQRLVDVRTTELTMLSSYLQSIAEREKQALARELHDALGGLLVATKMDVAWIKKRLGTSDPELLLRFERIQESLDRGVDLKRRIVEDLRPTLLDSMGLFSALRWHFDETCRRAGLNCTDRLPADEPRLLDEASIALFRIVQESFTNILKHSQATAAELEITLDDRALVLSVRDNGRGMPHDPQLPVLSHGLSGMRHRVQALGGRWEARSRESGGTEIRVELPLANILAEPAGAAEPDPARSGAMG